MQFLIKRYNLQTGKIEYRHGFMSYGNKDGAQTYTIDEAVIMAHQIDNYPYEHVAVWIDDTPVTETDIRMYYTGVGVETIVDSLYKR